MLLWKGGKRPLLFMAFSWKVNQGRHTECMYYYTRTTLHWATEAHGLWRGVGAPACTGTQRQSAC